MEKYVDKEMCKRCGGVCCKQTGCVYMPKDFENMNYKFLRKKLLEGNISISGQPANGLQLGTWTFVLYLRARNENANVVDLVTRGGKCKMLRKNGCYYKPKDRPSVGLSLKPIQEGGPCDQTVGSCEIADEWLKHQAVLHKLVNEFSGENTTAILVRELRILHDEIDVKVKNDEDLSAFYGNWFKWFKDIMDDNAYISSLKINKMR